MKPEKLNHITVADIRFWGKDEIAMSAWERIGTLRQTLKDLDAKAMIAEWIIL
jgi:hypothetical protein